MSLSRTLGAVAALTLAFGLAGCGSEITADTKCSDYISHPQSERYDAVVRISSELQVSDAGNPLWGPNTDYVCGSNPNSTVRQALGG